MSSSRRRRHDGVVELLVPAYGLADYGRLWFLTSNEVLTKAFWLWEFELRPIPFFTPIEEEILIFVINVDDYMYAGTPTVSRQFKSLLQNAFLIGTVKSKQFDIMGANRAQSNRRAIPMDARSKLMSIEPIQTEHIDKVKGIYQRQLRGQHNSMHINRWKASLRRPPC